MLHIKMFIFFLAFLQLRNKHDHGSLWRNVWFPIAEPSKSYSVLLIIYICNKLLSLELMFVNTVKSWTKWSEVKTFMDQKLYVVLYKLLEVVLLQFRKIKLHVVSITFSARWWSRSLVRRTITLIFWHNCLNLLSVK